ncbi:MAG: pyridoxamine 5'-phosphate oxidase family protein [Proteobacteria bacterium]|nr:pyridoxamine 5'-phosphate oxidase family protein [Pseudomonadota bacterium]
MDGLLADSAWYLKEVEGFLADYRSPLRLSVIGESGFPLICSLWFVYEEGRLLCATTRQAKVVECLRANPRCGFEIATNEPPYFGVRGQGVANVSSDGASDLLGSLVDRYLGSRETKFAGWLLSRSADEVTIEIEVRWMTSWDYTGRMAN